MSDQLISFDVQVSRQGSHNPDHKAKIRVSGVSFWYGEKQALKRVSLDFFAEEVTALIGPSGCGKSTLLRCLNRTNEIITDTRLEGQITLDGEDIYAPAVDPALLRRRFGWVAQKPNPFPKSVYVNVAYGARLHGLVSSRAETDALVEESLRSAGLWDEVKDRLSEPGTDLSGGQQQRLCVARALATRPEVLLMDEPCSALDPTATAHIEELIDRLRTEYAVIIITHNMQQAARISQRTAYFHLGEMIESGDTQDVFLNPQTPECSDYITGRFG